MSKDHYLQAGTSAGLPYTRIDLHDALAYAIYDALLAEDEQIRMGNISRGQAGTLHDAFGILKINRMWDEYRCRDEYDIETDMILTDSLREGRFSLVEVKSRNVAQDPVYQLEGAYQMDNRIKQEYRNKVSSACVVEVDETPDPETSYAFEQDANLNTFFGQSVPIALTVRRYEPFQEPIDEDTNLPHQVREDDPDRPLGESSRYAGPTYDSVLKIVQNGTSNHGSNAEQHRLFNLFYVAGYGIEWIWGDKNTDSK